MLHLVNQIRTMSVPPELTIGLLDLDSAITIIGPVPALQSVHFNTQPNL